MQNLFRLLLALILVVPVFAQRDIGVVDVQGDTQVMGITVSSSSAELQNLALQAFNAHGRYRLLASGGTYAVNFAPAGASAVTVTISRGGSVAHTQTVSGTSLRNALLKAADVAVNRTSGLKGWFAGKITFVGERTGKTEIYTSDVFFGELVKWTSDGKQVIGPRWSPDGSRLVFASGNPTPQLHVMPATGGTMTRLNTNVSRYCAEPDWSIADPNKIVFTAAVGRGYQSAVFDLKSGTSKIVTKAPTDAIEPVWLADGRHFICTFRGANTKALYIVDSESGKATRLSPTAMGNAGNASYLAP